MTQGLQAITLQTSVQVRAVQDTAFLARFSQPTSPSQVAQDLNIPANLAHYRARRYADLGLLAHSGRAGRRVTYRLASPVFHYPIHLLLPGDAGDLTYSLFQRLRDGLTRTESHGIATNRVVTVSFSNGDADIKPARLPGGMTIRQLCLTPERTRLLVDRLHGVLQEFTNDPTGDNITLALVHFCGELGD